MCIYIYKSKYTIYTYLCNCINYMCRYICIYIYIYCNIITTVLRRRGRTQNVSSIFQGVFDGCLERVKKRHLGDVQRPILHLRRSQKMHLTFWYGPPLKSGPSASYCFSGYALYAENIIISI